MTSGTKEMKRSADHDQRNEIGSEIPHQVRILIDGPALPVHEAIAHGWNPKDKY